MGTTFMDVVVDVSVEPEKGVDRESACVRACVWTCMFCIMWWMNFRIKRSVNNISEISLTIEKNETCPTNRKMQNLFLVIFTFHCFLLCNWQRRCRRIIPFEWWWFWHFSLIPFYDRIPATPRNRIPIQSPFHYFHHDFHRMSLKMLPIGRILCLFDWNTNPRERCISDS